jgi:tetratricopeptide (TPR) repeat protein
MREALATEPGADARVKADVGRSLTEVAALLDATGKTEEALATYRRSESLLADLESSDPEARGALAACRTRMALLMFYEDQYTGALAALKLARAAQDSLAAAPGASNDARRELAETVNRTGFVLWNMGKPAEAERQFREALSIYKRLSDENNAVSEFQRGLGACHFYLGGALWDEGKPVEAEAELRAAIALKENAVKANPGVTQNRRSLVVSGMYLGHFLAATGRPAAAETEYRTVLSILKNLMDENAGQADLLSLTAVVHSSLGILLLQIGKPQDAEVECRIGETISQQLVDKNRSKNANQWGHVEALINLGDVVRFIGRAIEAQRIYSQAIAFVESHIQEGAESFDHRLALIRSLRRRGTALRDVGDAAAAAVDVRRVLWLCNRAEPLQICQYERACCHGVLAGLGGRPGSKVSAAEAETEAANAIKWLRQAIALGYRNVNEFRIESAFDSLRGREDYRKLMADLERAQKNDKPKP